MLTYRELLAQKRDLDMLIAEARRAQASAALDQIREQIAEFGFTAQQVFPWTPPKQKAAAKYRDSTTGRTWSGYGKPPKWLHGKDRTEFLIVDP